MKLIREILESLGDSPKSIKNLLDLSERAEDVKEVVKWLVEFGMMEVHTFGDRIDEHIAWINGKGAILLDLLNKETD